MITILIPTLNRPEFLYRALRYYAEARFGGVISIGDSSDSINSANNLSSIEKVKSRVNVDYRHYDKEKYDIGSVMKDQIDRVETPYAAVCCDDDFLNVNGVEQCVSFLNDHPHYASARGIRLNFALTNMDSVYGSIDQLQYVPSLDLEDDFASARWAAYINCNTATAYNVHRKETFQKMWHHIDHFSTYDIRYELFPCSVSCLSGKVRNLDVLYNVVQQHHGSVSCSGRITIYDALMSEGWSSDVKNFCDYISRELVEKENWREADARSFFKKEFEKYLFSHFLYQAGSDNKKIDIDRITNMAIRIRTFVRNSPRLYAFLRRMMTRKVDISSMYKCASFRHVSVASIMSPSSPYRADFSTLARIISNPDPEP